MHLAQRQPLRRLLDEQLGHQVARERGDVLGEPGRRPGGEGGFSRAEEACVPVAATAALTAAVRAVAAAAERNATAAAAAAAAGKCGLHCVPE